MNDMENLGLFTILHEIKTHIEQTKHYIEMQKKHNERIQSWLVYACTQDMEEEEFVKLFNETREDFLNRMCF